MFYSNEAPGPFHPHWLPISRNPAVRNGGPKTQTKQKRSHSLRSCLSVCNQTNIGRSPSEIHPDKSTLYDYVAVPHSNPHSRFPLKISRWILSLSLSPAISTTHESIVIPGQPIASFFVVGVSTHTLITPCQGRIFELWCLS